MVLVGCQSKPELYTEDYLKEHDDVRAKVLAECKENKQPQANCTLANGVETQKKQFKKY